MTIILCFSLWVITKHNAFSWIFFTDKPCQSVSQTAGGEHPSRLDMAPTLRVGDNATYICGFPYVMEGHSTITCNEQSQWDSIPPNCTRECSIYF